MNRLKSMQAVLQRNWLPIALVVFLLGAAPSGAWAYVLAGYQWPSGQDIELDLQLGSPSGTLIDGATSWDDVVTSAASIWNPYLGSGVQFTTRKTNFTPAQRDGRNSVFFSASVFGEGFGDDTLATTVTLYNSQTHVAGESDVVFNVAQSFNSYRGPLRANGAATVYDLRRVALHELGHTLGLAHVPQGTTAIMEPDITDLDTLQADDIAGVAAIYGNPGPTVPVINGDLSISRQVGQPFSYRISATGNPVSYQVSGLPDGLSIDPGTGVISGTPTAAGTYNVAISATNNAGTGMATLTLVLGNSPTITSSLAVTAYVGRAFYYQITTGGPVRSFYTLSLPDGLTLDTVTGLISGTPTTAGFFRVYLDASGVVGSDSATLLLTINYDATATMLYNFDALHLGTVSLSDLLESSDGNLYGAVYYYNGDDNSSRVFKLTADGQLTRLPTSTATGGIFSPLTLHQAADGSFYGTVAGANDTIFRLTADGNVTMIGSIVLPLYSPSTSPTVLLASDGNYYGTIPFYTPEGNDHAGSVFKLTPDGTLTTLHQFSGPDGNAPSALIQASDGDFYGTTYQGGSNGYGTVFRITPDGNLTTLHHFAAAEGTFPATALLEASDGNFYGTTTASAGGQGGGTVFKMTPDGTLTTLHNFTGAEGQDPRTTLVQASDGSFYGATNGYGGTNNEDAVTGTLFKLGADGVLTTVHIFTINDGAAPYPAPFLIVTPDGAGNLYCGTSSGIIKITPTAVPLVYAPQPVVVPTVTLNASTPQVTVDSGGAAEFTVSLSAVQDHDVMISYTIKGSATNGTDYVLLKGTKKIKAGKLSKPIKIVPQGDLSGAAKKTVVLTLQPGDGYMVGTTGKVKVKILSGQ